MSENEIRDRFAILGIGCRFPGSANTPEQFWKLLCDGTDAITEIPPDRFNLAEVYDADPGRPGKLYSRWGGFADHVDRFDAEFFGISPREAVRIDPQQRMLLEVVWETLEDAGLIAGRLTGSKTGVFIGISTHDYGDLQSDPVNWHRVDTYSSTGTALSIAANRISYVYDLRGPSFIVDTACSSSLTAVHLACRSLREGACDLAIAGGVNAILTPATGIGFCRAAMISPDGRCKAFDVAANGFVRGEGAGVIVLKPLPAAVADGDRIYAVVLGSAINQDGRTVGLMVPSANAQETLIREALRNARVEPEAVQYVEAHGTGTRAGDPIEAAAIAKALATGREPGNPCLIGSVKTNIGHLEAAAGISGVIKTALALRHRMIPPSLHFHSPNPAIPLEELRLRVVTRLQSWPGNGTAALAGVNSFGFGGANAHVVLGEAPPQNDQRAATDGRSPHILPISARHPNALRELAGRYREFLAAAGAPSMRDLSYSAAARRSHHRYRAAFVGADPSQVIESIDAFLAQEASGQAASTFGGLRDREPKLAFVYTGMGPQWWGMGRQLYEKEPIFRTAVIECDRLFRNIGNWSLMEALSADEPRSRVHEADLAPAANLAIQVGLTRLWRSWGISPGAVVGHSAGEIGAFWAAGTLSLEDAFKVAFHRGRLQHRLVGRGTMLAAGVSEEEALRLAEPVSNRVAVAAINSPGSVTFSGERQALEEMAQELTRQQRFNRFLPVEVPYHAPCFEALREEFIALLSSVTPAPASMPVISTVTGNWMGETPANANYWYENLRRPVRFASAIERLIEDGYDLFIEIGPHPVLAASITECLAPSSKSAIALPSLRRKEEERQTLLRTIAVLYGRGCDVDWSGVCGKGRLVSLPHYPWQRERHWFEGEQGSNRRPSGTPSGHPLLGNRLRSVRPCWEVDLGQPAHDYLDDHVVQGKPVFPGAAYAEMALAAAAAIAPGKLGIVEEVTFRKVLFLSQRSETLLHFIHEPQTSSFEIHSLTQSNSAGWTLHALGKLKPKSAEAARAALDLSAVRGRCPAEIPVSEAYRALQARGLNHQGVFRGMEALWHGKGEALARIAWPADSPADAKPYCIHPALLDSAFQTMLSAAESVSGDNPQGLFLPVSISRLTFYRTPGTRFWSYARITKFEPDAVESDLTLFDGEGAVAMVVEGLRCKALEGKKGLAEATLDGLLYQLTWEPKPLEKRLLRETISIQGAAELGASMQAVADRLASERNWSDQLQRSEPLANRIAAHYARAALLDLGWTPDETVSGDQRGLAERLGIASRHQRFLGRLLEITSEFGHFKTTASSAHEERAAAESLCVRLTGEFPECAAVVDLLRRCGEHLDAILRGEADARQVLFAPETMASWVRFFVDIPWFDFYNLLVADAIAAAVKDSSPGTPLRVLEIGAGTGGTTFPVLRRLRDRKVEYHFTDISTYFLARAREHFKDRPNVHVGALDIEIDPAAQLGSEPFDVVLAANVLHATADLRKTLKNIQRLLRPGALLVLLELASKRAWVDLIFGITEGWWRFTDTDLRPGYPLLSPPQWQKVLTETGFEAAASVSEAHGGESPFHAVLMATMPEDAKRPADTRPARDWIVCLDSAGVGFRIAQSLRQRGDRCIGVSRGADFARLDPDSFEMAPDRADQVALLVKELSAARFRFHGLIHGFSLDHSFRPGSDSPQVIADAQSTCGGVIALVQGFEQAGRALPPLWLLTSDTQTVEQGRAGANLTQAPVWGLGRVMASELTGVPCRLVDFGPHLDGSEVQSFLDELDADDREEEVAFRGTRRYVTRLRRRGLSDLRSARQVRPLSPDVHQFRLGIDNPGALESLTIRETVGRRPGRGEVLIRVYAAGVNFRDVMLSLGLLPPIPIPGEGGKAVLGFECAGTVIECGEAVEEFRPGDEVIAMATGSFASQIVARAEMVARKPVHLTFEQAATIPQAFITAYYGLNHLARLAEGERVLIHAATGGVGLAAIQLARLAGAEIFATAGSPEKRAYLAAMGVDHVMDSRSLAFADEVLAATNGEGVDVVLNSLAGDAIPKGLLILRPYGRFIELGKRDILADASVGLLPFDKNISLSSVALDRLYLDRHPLLGSMAREIGAMLESGVIEPIPHTAFDLSKGEEALRFLAQARHIGKLVLTIREESYPVGPCLDRPVIRGDGTYVISGGLGGFGLAVARWLVEKGAQHIVLMSRRGLPTAENESAFLELRQSGADIVVFKGDVGDETDVQRMLEEIRHNLPPLHGIVHAAMVLDDSPLATMSPGQLEAVISPKVGGAWILHRLTAGDDLDFFLLFASATSVLGARGQGSYAAANHFLDALAPYRRSLGLPALTIDWGAVGDVGYLSRHPVIMQHLTGHGIEEITPAETVAGLELALRLGISDMALMRVDWARYSKIDEASVLVRKSQRLADFLSAEPTAAQDAPASRGSFLATLNGREPGQTQHLVERHMMEQVARVLGTSVQKVDPSVRLTEMGVDSLMAVELQILVKRDFGISLPLAILLEGGTVAQLTARVLEQLVPEATSTPGKSGPAVSPAPAEEIETASGAQGSAGLSKQVPHAQTGAVDEPATTVPPALEPAPAGGRLPEPVPADCSGNLQQNGSSKPGETTVPVSTGEADRITVTYDSVETRWTLPQRSVRHALSVLLKLAARVEVTGLENIPRSGPVLLACNHLSMIDLPLMVAIAPRRGAILAADRLRGLPSIRWFLNLGDCIYVRRGEADQEALGKGLAVLSAGGMLGIAPEGTRSRSGGLTRGRTGVAYLAARAPAPVVPVALYGHEQIPRNLGRSRRSAVRVRIGSPIEIEPGEKTAAQLRRDTDRIMETIAAMLPPGYRGIYADSAQESDRDAQIRIR